MLKKFLLLILMIFVSYCNTGKLIISDEKIEKVSLIQDPAHFNFDSIKVDSFQINHGSIVGNVLTLNVTIIGGCKQHSFKLFSTHAIHYSNPPQADVILMHNANGDSCTSSIVESLMFDLNPLEKNIWLRINQFPMHGDSILFLFYE